MATSKILTNPDRQTLEIPLEELKEIREILNYWQGSQHGINA